MKHSKALKRYTPADDLIISDYVSQYPSNLTVAFEQAAQQLGRSPSGVMNRFHNTVKHNPTPTYAIATNRGVMVNQKVNRRITPKPKLRAFDVALMAVDEMTQDELKALIIHMIKRTG